MTIALHLKGPETALFQLRGRRNLSSGTINVSLNHHTSCQPVDFLCFSCFLQSGGYFNFIRSAVVEAINNSCSCGFTFSFISQEQLYCDQLAPVEFVYRATISSYGTYSTDQLLDYIEQWVSSGVTLTYHDSSQLTFDPECLLRISSYDDQLCGATAVTTTQTLPLPSQTVVPPRSPPAAIFVGIIVGCILLSTAVAGSILMLCFFVQRKTRKNR